MTRREIAGRLEVILADDSEGWGAVARLADEVRADADADAEASHDVPDCPVCVAKGRALADAEWRGVAETLRAEGGTIRAERDRLADDHALIANALERIIKIMTSGPTDGPGEPWNRLVRAAAEVSQLAGSFRRKGNP